MNGVAAKMYEVSGDHGTARRWRETDSSRPLTLENGTTGTVAPHGIKTGKGVRGLKVLQAQLHAARVEHHLHNTMTYDYDPSLKIDMPTN